VAVQVRELGGIRFRPHRRLEPARAETEPEELAHLRAALANEVGAGDAAVDDAVLHVLGNVGSADEQNLDRRVSTRERERTLARDLGAEAGIVEKVDSRIAQPSLCRDGDFQPVRERRR
jgi:hypothetical protein